MTWSQQIPLSTWLRGNVCILGTCFHCYSLSSCLSPSQVGLRLTSHWMTPSKNSLPGFQLNLFTPWTKDYKTVFTWNLCKASVLLWNVRCLNISFYSWLQLKPRPKASHFNILLYTENRSRDAVQWWWLLFCILLWEIGCTNGPNQCSSCVYTLPCDFVVPPVKGWTLFPKPWISFKLVFPLTDRTQQKWHCTFLCLGSRDPA